jgi:hypothetical protein
MLDWLFRDRETGEITIAQFPNLPLWIFLFTLVTRAFIRHGPVSSVLDAVGLLALGWWAMDELVRGVNPWRRLLGLGGCAFVISAAVALVR